MPKNCGYVSLTGRPNSGKSSLLNRILGQPLCLVSAKPQTTRHRILGIQQRETAQAVYIDSPGIHCSHDKLLNRRLNRTAQSILSEADVIIFMSQALRWTADDSLVLSRLPRNEKTPVIWAINKIDKVPEKRFLLPHIAQISPQYPFAAVLPLSARTGLHVERLENLIDSFLPVQDLIFPEDMVTDRDLRFLIAEWIRGAFMRRLQQELPYALNVSVESLRQNKKGLAVEARIWVAKRSQQAIVIGSRGQHVKSCGIEARKRIENFCKRSVDLRLRVKTLDGWYDNARALDSFGYG